MNFKIEVVLSSVFVVIMGVLSGIPAAEAQMTIGGHVGFVLPLVTHAAGQTTTIADNFSIGFPLESPSKGMVTWLTISSWFPAFEGHRG